MSVTLGNATVNRVVEVTCQADVMDEIALGPMTSDAASLALRQAANGLREIRKLVDKPSDG